MQSPAIDQAASLLKGRLADIKQEGSQIEKALAGLSPNGKARRRGRPAGSTTKRRRPRRQGGGTRATEAIELIRSRPDITASEIAGVMKIKPNYLYRVLGDLEKQKLVKKTGRKYQVTAKAKPPTPAKD